MLAIAQRHGLDGEPCASFPTGSDVVWRVGEGVVKLSLPRWRAELETERQMLTHVHGRLSLRTPEILAHGELEGWPYVVMSFVEGRALTELWPSLDATARRRLARRLGESTRELHSLPIPTGAGEEGAGEDWSAFWARCREAAADNHRRRMQGRVELLDQVEPFLQRVGPLDDSGRVLLHTELLEHHVLVDGEGEELAPSGLIDFADARVGPPAYDFPAVVEFIFRGEPGLLGAFFEGYGDPGLGAGEERSQRLLAWALQHRFGSLPRMLALVEDRPPGSLEELAGRLYA